MIATAMTDAIIAIPYVMTGLIEFCREWMKRVDYASFFQS